MTSQKRPASVALSHYPAPKHPRVASYEPEPEPEPHSGNMGDQGLWTKWGHLVWETASYLLGNKSDSLPQFNFDPPPLPPPLSKPRANGTPLVSPPRRPFRPSNGIMPSNILASTSSTRSSLHVPYPSSSATSSSTTNTFATVDELESTPRTSRVASQTSSRVPSQSFSTLSSEQSQDVQVLARHLRFSNLKENVVRKPYRRKHIYGDRHKAKVKEGLKKLYELAKLKGYQSDFNTFEGRVRYELLLERTRSSTGKSKLSLEQLVTEEEEILHVHVERAIQRAKLSAQSPSPARPFNPSLDELERHKNARCEAVIARLRAKRPRLPEQLPEDELREVEKYKKIKGHVSSAGKEKVLSEHLERLYLPRSKGWLNDEVINFYGQLIMDRSALPKFPAVHYFSSFFWTKLTEDGYEKGRLNRWTKKLDIFKKEYILLAVNHGGVHWTSAAINFKRKRVESYDSMGRSRPEVYKVLRNYLDLEHRDKKKKPFDFTEWKNYAMENYPQQENGFDCGVFTCATLEAIARGEEEFIFTQANMKYIRNKIILEIGRAKLSDSR